MSKIEYEGDPHETLWQYWTDNPGELGKALLDPDGAGLNEFERESVRRLRERLSVQMDQAEDEERGPR